MNTTLGSGSSARPEPGRRDFFVLAFLVYALLGLSKLALIHALLIAGPLFIIPLVQVVWRLRGSPE